MVTQAEVKELFDYDVKTGDLIWRVELRNTKIGMVAGTKDISDYIQINFNCNRYQAHRIIWLWYYGYMPENNIDHIDRNKSNNRIENLREVSIQCNARNTGNRKDNKSGVKGISWIKRDEWWLASITIKGKSYSLCTSIDFSEAVCHRLAVEQCIKWEGCDDSSPAYKYIQEMLF